MSTDSQVDATTRSLNDSQTPSNSRDPGDAKVRLRPAAAATGNRLERRWRSPLLLNIGGNDIGARIVRGKARSVVLRRSYPAVSYVGAFKRAASWARSDDSAATRSSNLAAGTLQPVSRGLKADRQHLVLAPSITDIAGPRLHTRPVAGLPLVHVETPRFSKGQLSLKRSVDLTATIIGVVLLSPLFAFLAMSIRLSSQGPVLFRQVRIGRGGREFTMLKFRSMVTNAEELLENLQRERAEQGMDSGNEVMFKMKNDPRVTPIGRIMRKYSLDELPQLFNVLGGSMSLVGPRPPLPSEVEQYATHVHRRFLVKPGITGLWQVSGRSTLSWEDTVRLDLSYVENWSLVGDIAILAKTAKAAIAPGDTAA